MGALVCFQASYLISRRLCFVKSTVLDEQGRMFKIAVLILLRRGKKDISLCPGCVTSYDDCFKSYRILFSARLVSLRLVLGCYMIINLAILLLVSF